MRFQRESSDTFKGISLSRQSEGFESLPAVATGKEEVQPNVESISFEWADDCTPELPDRNCRKAIA